MEMTKAGYDTTITQLQYYILKKKSLMTDLQSAKAPSIDEIPNEPTEFLLEEIHRVDDKIRRLQNGIYNAKVIDSTDLSDTSVAKLGHKVEIHLDGEEDNVIVQLVSSIEADPIEDRISVDGPLGELLLGNGVGFVADTDKFRVTIISISV